MFCLAIFTILGIVIIILTIFLCFPGLQVLRDCVSQDADIKAASSSNPLPLGGGIHVNGEVDTNTNEIIKVTIRVAGIVRGVFDNFDEKCSKIFKNASIPLEFALHNLFLFSSWDINRD